MILLVLLSITTVDRTNPANQLRLVVYPIISNVLYMLDGAGFQPPTVFLVHILFRLLYSTFLLPYIAIYLLLLLVILLPKMVYLGMCKKKLI